MSYEAIIFDNDGVLAELTDPSVVRTATREAFEAFDLSPTEDHVDVIASGVTVDRLEHVCEEYAVDPNAFWEQRDTAISRVQQTEIRAGRKPLYEDTEALWDCELPYGIVSSNQHATIECLLEEFTLFGRFETYYGRKPTIEDLRRKKPDPYFIERAMADLGTEKALYVGDSKSDVTAAANAGIDSAFIRREHRTDTVLSEEPTYEIENLWELNEIVG